MTELQGKTYCRVHECFGKEKEPNMIEPITIVVSSDENYAQHVGVMLQSMFSNLQATSSLCIYLIDGGISSTNRMHIQSIVESHGGSLQIIHPDTTDYERLPKARYGLAAYQRVSMAECLPKSVNKVIYLDADTLVFDDIAKLWSVRLGDKPLAAVENFSPTAHCRGGFSRQAYFNSGVLVTYLDYWRSNSIKKQVIEYLDRNHANLRCYDQCGLNHAFQNNWLKLLPEWNQQGDLFRVIRKYAQGCGYTHQQLLHAIQQPSIAHFIGTQKPWLWRSFSPFKKHYRHYLSQTPWAGKDYQDDSIANRIRYTLSFRKRFHQFKQEQMTLKVPQ